jgi:hypothetical protein
MKQLRGRWRRGLLSAAGALVALLAAWLALVIHPQPLFAHSLERGPVVLYAREPFPESAAPMLEEALRRLSRSPFYDAKQRHAVFLCDGRALYRFLTLAAKGRGITSPFGNVFIDAAGVRAKGGDLAYFVAHELTHALVQSRFGYFSQRKLAPFQREGYADYVAFADTPPSGPYLHYRRLVAHLLERRGLTAEQLLSKPLDRARVERDLE